MTIGAVKQALAELCNRPEIGEEGKLLKHNPAGSGYTSLQDSEVLGMRKQLWIMNADITAATGAPDPKDFQRRMLSLEAAEGQRQVWRIVGGSGGGILVRQGPELSAAKVPERLEQGATVEELHMLGERLHFRRLTGSGPDEGWIAVKIGTKALAVRTGDEGEEDAEEPREPELVMVTVTHAMSSASKAASTVDIVVMSNLLMGAVKEALAAHLKKPDVATKGRFVQRKGAASFSGIPAQEPLGDRRELLFMGTELQ